MRAVSIRIRMMLLFCAVAGALLGLTFGGSYLVFERVVREALDRKLQQVAGPIVADLVIDPEEKDVDALDLPGEYFEVVDPAGRVLQRSKNLRSDLPLTPAQLLQTVQTTETGELRAALTPFQADGKSQFLVVAAPTRDVETALQTLRRFAAVLFPISFLLTAIVFGYYANQLFSRIDAVVGQLRQFVSDASHELRTPLAVLRGENELLLSKQRSASEYESAARIMDEELKKLSHIVDGLFTLSMADAGQLRVAAEPLYLEEVLEESCSLAAPLATQKRIQIDRELQRDVLVSGDATFLRQLFLIFIDNAIKYSPSGTRLHVMLTVQEKVRIRFKDEGVGIAKEDVPRIFQRFFRANAVTIETQSGGLGLSIAQAIVQAHAGTIECESQPGVGSIFTITLPLATSM